jgi:hypothetical protein
MPARKRMQRSLTCNRRLISRVRLLRPRRNRSKVSHLFPPFVRRLDSFGIRSQLNLCFGFQACGTHLGTRQPRRSPCRRPTTPRNRSWSCEPPPSRRARGSRKARRRSGARWQVASAPSAGTLPNPCAVPFTWVFRRPSVWWLLTTRLTSRPFPWATSSLSATTRWR